MKSILALLLSVAPLAAQSLPVASASSIADLLQGPQITVTATGAPSNPGTAPTRFTSSAASELLEIARMRGIAPLQVELNRAPLGTVIRFLADAVKMNYLTIPEDPLMATLVSMSVKKNPYDILIGITRTYGVDILYRDGFWQFLTLNSHELIQRTYQLRFTTLGNVSRGGASSSPASGSGGSGLRSSMEQGSNQVFKTDSKEFLQKITTLLGLPVSGSEANIAGTASVGNFGNIATSQFANLKSDAATSERKNLSTVFYNDDTNSLYVVASRQQHQLLEAYLASTDKPQKQIYLETKFVLSTTNPTTQRGIDSAILNKGLSIVPSSDLSIDFGHLAATKFPTAILSAADLTARLQFVARGRDSSQVQYPTQTTLSGREVLLRSVAQVPVISTRSQTSGLGAGNSSTSDVEFIDVGTTVNILPRVLDDDAILLNISITVSSITGTQEIDGNSYPITSTQVYSNEVIVRSGFSLSMGGLESSLKSMNSAKVPWLGDLPFFGFAFKTLNKDNTRTFLTLYVTPTLLPDYKGGNFAGPQHTTPAFEQSEARSTFDGDVHATVDDVIESLRGVDREVSNLVQAVREGRGDAELKKTATLLRNELRLMDVTLREADLAGKPRHDLRKKVRTNIDRLTSVIWTTPTGSGLYPATE